MFFSGCQFQLLPSQIGTIYILLQVITFQNYNAYKYTNSIQNKKDLYLYMSFLETLSTFYSSTRKSLQSPAFFWFLSSAIIIDSTHISIWIIIFFFNNTTKKIFLKILQHHMMRKTMLRQQDSVYEYRDFIFNFL